MASLSLILCLQFQLLFVWHRVLQERNMSRCHKCVPISILWCRGGVICATSSPVMSLFWLFSCSISDVSSRANALRMECSRNSLINQSLNIFIVDYVLSLLVIYVQRGELLGKSDYSSTQGSSKHVAFNSQQCIAIFYYWPSVLRL